MEITNSLHKPKTISDLDIRIDAFGNYYIKNSQ